MSQLVRSPPPGRVPRSPRSPRRLLNRNLRRTTPPALPAGWGRWSNDSADDLLDRRGAGRRRHRPLVATAAAAAAAGPGSARRSPATPAPPSRCKADSLVPGLRLRSRREPRHRHADLPRRRRHPRAQGRTLQVIDGDVTVLGIGRQPGLGVLLRAVGPRRRSCRRATRSRFESSRRHRPVPERERHLAGGRDERDHRDHDTHPGTGFVGVGRLGTLCRVGELDNFAVLRRRPRRVARVVRHHAGRRHADRLATWLGERPARSEHRRRPRASARRTGSPRPAAPPPRPAPGSTTDLPADVDAVGRGLLDSLIPARVFVRGTNLDTARRRRTTP